MSALIGLVKQDVFAFLESNDELLFNERDFQMHLANWLRKSSNRYDDVDVEYYVPKSELEDYVWDSELRLDIVVKKDGYFKGCHCYIPRKVLNAKAKCPAGKW